MTTYVCIKEWANDDGRTTVEMVTADRDAARLWLGIWTGNARVEVWRDEWREATLAAGSVPASDLDTYRARFTA